MYMSSIEVQHLSSLEPHVSCGYCSRFIVLGKTETNHTLYRLQGRPICVICRVLRGKTGGRIRADKGNYAKDLRAKKQHEHTQEGKRILTVAAESQERTPNIAGMEKSDRRRFTI